MTPVDIEIARRAEPQHGLITLRQLTDLGLDKHAVGYRVRVGRLHRVHRGVYAVGHVPPSPLARAMAAVLACGPGAVLSHRWATALWGIDPRWRDPVEVTAASRHRHRGLRVHRSCTLSRDDGTTNFGIPVTTPARTLLDLADVLGDKALARAVNDAQIRRLLTLDELAAVLARSPGRATTRLEAFVQRGEPPTRSALEDEFLALVERHGLPRPEINQRVAGHEVDMFWRRQRLIAELDGRAFHDTQLAHERDRDRDADFGAAGHRVVRITWRRLRDAPDREARRLKAALRAAPRADRRPWQ